MSRDRQHSSDSSHVSGVATHRPRSDPYPPSELRVVNEKARSAPTFPIAQSFDEVYRELGEQGAVDFGGRTPYRDPVLDYFADRSLASILDQEFDRAYKLERARKAVYNVVTFFRRRWGKDRNSLAAGGNSLAAGGANGGASGSVLQTMSGSLPPAP